MKTRIECKLKEFRSDVEAIMGCIESIEPCWMSYGHVDRCSFIDAIDNLSASIGYAFREFETEAKKLNMKTWSR